MKTFPAFILALSASTISLAATSVQRVHVEVSNPMRRELKEDGSKICRYEGSVRLPSLPVMNVYHEESYILDRSTEWQLRSIPYTVKKVSKSEGEGYDVEFSVTTLTPAKSIPCDVQFFQLIKQD